MWPAALALSGVARMRASSSETCRLIVVPIQNLSRTIDDGVRRGLVSLRCARSFALVENLEPLYPMRDVFEPHCSTKRKPSERRARGLRRTRQSGREIRDVSIR